VLHAERQLRMGLRFSFGFPTKLKVGGDKSWQAEIERSYEEECA
jgi:hypothetical protein